MDQKIREDLARAIEALRAIAGLDHAPHCDSTDNHECCGCYGYDPTAVAMSALSALGADSQGFDFQDNLNIKYSLTNYRNGGGHI